MRCDNMNVFYLLCKNTSQRKYADHNSIVLGKYTTKATTGQLILNR